MDRLLRAVIADHEVDIVGDQRRDEVVDVANHDRTTEPAVLRPGRPPGRQPGRRHRERQRDPDVLVTVQRFAAEFSARVEHLPQQVAGVLAETLALRRQLRRVDAAVDQIKAEPRLQRFDAAAECGLGGVSPLGRPRKTLQLGHRGEISKLMQLHRHNLSF